MFVEKEIRNFTLSNGSSVQIVVDSPFFYVYVNGTRFRTNESPASYSGSYLSSYLHRNLGLDDRVQVKYKNYYCSLFMPDKKKRVEIEVTPLEEKRICVTAKVNNAKVYRKIEQKPFRLFRDIQDLEIYRQLRTEYLNCVRQYNFLSFNTEKIASMFDYELVQVFRKSYEILREPSEPYKEYMKNILRLMYEDACKRGFSQPVGQPSNAKVIKHDVDVPDIKVSSVESNRDTKVSSVASNRDVVSSMPDEKKLNDINDNTDEDEDSPKMERELMSDEEFHRRFKIRPIKIVTYEEYLKFCAEGKGDDFDFRFETLEELNKAIKHDRQASSIENSKDIQVSTDEGFRDNSTPDGGGVSTDSDYGDDYGDSSSDDEEDYGDDDVSDEDSSSDASDVSSDNDKGEDLGEQCSSDKGGDSSDENDSSNDVDSDLGDEYSSDDNEDYGDYSADGDEDYGDYDSDDEDYGDGYFSDSDDKNYSSEEDVSDDDYSSDDEDYGDYASDDDSDYGDYFSDDEDNYGDDDYSSDDEDYGDDYASDKDRVEDLGEEHSLEANDIEDTYVSDDNDYSSYSDADYSSDDSEDYGDYSPDDEDLSDEDSGIEDDYGDYSSDDDEDYGDYASDDDYGDYSADDEEDYGDGYDSGDEDFGDNYGN